MDLKVSVFQNMKQSFGTLTFSEYQQHVRLHFLINTFLLYCFGKKYCMLRESIKHFSTSSFTHDLTQGEKKKTLLYYMESAQTCHISITPFSRGHQWSGRNTTCFSRGELHACEDYLLLNQTRHPIAASDIATLSNLMISQK